MDKIKVLIIDDSPLVRKVLTEIISSDDRFDVVGAASNPLIGRDKIKSLNPDVVTLDVEMPKMDGITFLKNLMRLRPMPVVMISTLTEKGAGVTLDALEIGAVDYVSKPKEAVGENLSAYAEEIIQKLLVASTAHVRAFEPENFKSRIAPVKSVKSSDKIQWILIGASTGGTEAIKEVLTPLPERMPPILITQHIPPEFSDSFADRMNRCCALEVIHSRGGELILPGHVYLAPGGAHLEIEKKGGQFYTKLNDGERVNRHKPSVEVMFDSALQHAGSKQLAVMLTGMGADGAQAMQRLKQAGAFTIAQDQESSVVWGMPGAVVQMGAADEVLGLSKIAQRLVNKVAE